MEGAPSAVVTGAGSGIGRSLAHILSERGYGLLLLDIDPVGLKRVATDVNPELSVVADVADWGAMESFAARCRKPDLLCLNAGVVSSCTGPPWEAPPAEWARVLGVNLDGVVNGLRAFVPRLVQAGTPSRILITASLAGAATWPGGGPYAASKHAVLAVAEQTALFLADSDVRVTVSCPALVRTGMSPVGDDPHVVATEALDAVDHGVFAVIPREWSAAVRTRADNLVHGAQPTTPASPSRRSPPT